MLWTQTTPLDIEDNRIEIVDSLSLAEKPTDSLVKEPLLLDKVKYTAKEKVNINRRENKLYKNHQRNKLLRTRQKLRRFPQIRNQI